MKQIASSGRVIAAQPAAAPINNAHPKLRRRRHRSHAQIRIMAASRNAVSDISMKDIHRKYWRDRSINTAIKAREPPNSSRITRKNTAAAVAPQANGEAQYGNRSHTAGTMLNAAPGK